MELEGYSLVTVSKQWSQDLNLTHKSRDVTVTFRHLIFLEQPFYIWYEFVFQKSKKKKKKEMGNAYDIRCTQVLGNF